MWALSIICILGGYGRNGLYGRYGLLFGRLERVVHWGSMIAAALRVASHSRTRSFAMTD